MIGALLFSLITIWMVKDMNPRKVDKNFRRLQLLSAAVYSLSHGSNDAQKTIGIISIALFTNGLLGATFYVPTWVIFLSYSCYCLRYISSAAGKLLKRLGCESQNLLHLEDLVQRHLQD